MRSERNVARRRLGLYLPLAVCPLPLQQLGQHHTHVLGRAVQVGLGEQLARRKTERLLEPLKLFITGRIRDAAGLDQREVRLGNAGPPRQLVERKPEPAALSAEFGSERFNHDLLLLRVTGSPAFPGPGVRPQLPMNTSSLPYRPRQEKYRTNP